MTQSKPVLGVGRFRAFHSCYLRYQVNLSNFNKKLFSSRSQVQAPGIPGGEQRVMRLLLEPISADFFQTSPCRGRGIVFSGEFRFRTTRRRPSTCGSMPSPTTSQWLDSQTGWAANSCSYESLLLPYKRIFNNFNGKEPLENRPFIFQSGPI